MGLVVEPLWTFRSGEQSWMVHLRVLMAVPPVCLRDEIFLADVGMPPGGCPLVWPFPCVPWVRPDSGVETCLLGTIVCNSIINLVTLITLVYIRL